MIKKKDIHFSVTGYKESKASILTKINHKSERMFLLFKIIASIQQNFRGIKEKYEQNSQFDV